MSGRNTYRATFGAMCPVDGEKITYALQIETDGVVLMAEDIRKAVLGIDVGLHEDIADRLFVTFGGRQILTATHGGVHIETLRE